MVKYILGLLLSTISVLAQLGPHSDNAFLGQFLSQPTDAPLTNGIEAYWTMDDAGGSLTNIVVGKTNYSWAAIDTMDTKVDGGKIFKYARTSIFSYLGQPYSVTNFQVGPGRSFTFSGWFMPYADPGTNNSWVVKSGDYSMGLSGNYANPKFIAVNLAGSSVSVTSTNSSLYGWNHIVFGYDNSTSNIWIQVNGGTRISKACAGVKASGADQLRLSGNVVGPSASFDELAFWYLSLTPSQVVTLYGQGLGSRYPFDPLSQQVVDRWATQVTYNGGAAVSTGTKTSLVTFATAISDNSLWSRFITLNCFVPDNLIASITPLRGATIWGNVNFVAGDLSVNGLTGNRSSKHLSTGVIPSSVWGNDTSCGLSVYIYLSARNTNTVIMSSLNGAVTCGLVDVEAGHMGDAYNTTINGGRTYSIDSKTNGFISLNRTTADGANLYWANSNDSLSSLTNNAGTGGTRPTTYDIYVFARNGNGSAINWTGDTLSFAAIHQPLSSNSVFVLYNAVQKLRQDFGGGYR